MLRNLRERSQAEQGFTLIELLVVILIIGILAAIAIPSFLNQRGKGNDAEAKSTVVTASEAMDTCATDHSGSYATCDRTALVAIEPTLADAGTRLVTGTAAADKAAALAAPGAACSDSVPGASSYAVCVASTRNAAQVRFRLDRLGDGTTVRTCTKGTESNGGGCPSSGDWGQ